MEEWSVKLCGKQKYYRLSFLISIIIDYWLLIIDYW
jgi:hypothetical protein